MIDYGYQFNAHVIAYWDEVIDRTEAVNYTREAISRKWGQW